MTISLTEVRQQIDRAFSANRFQTASGYEARVEHCGAEEIPWEIFRGHLLDAGRTRERREFETWHLRLLKSGNASDIVAQPIVSLRLDHELNELHVTRQIHVHGWEAIETSPGVIDSRATTKWLMELVGTLDFADVENFPALELETRISQALLGISRLPITSLEAPHPAFSLGEIHYLLGRKTPEAAVRRLEFQLRGAAPAEVPALADAWLRETELLVRLFNDVSLTPYTRFTENLVVLLRHLALKSPLSAASLVPIARIVATLLRLLTRHLTAFDLVRFHSRGANYPDALVLDALLKLLLELVMASPQLFENEDRDAQSVRRAARQAWLQRKQMERLTFPDSPTSLGENQRVLPTPHVRVAEEQITDPERRSKRLFQHEPAEVLLNRPPLAAFWRLAWRELSEPRALRELGAALFLDRPLGIFLEEGAVDRTPLLSYEAFSRSIAAARLDELAAMGVIGIEHHDTCRSRLREISDDGFPVAKLTGPPRTGVVSLEDARLVADDFHFVRTTRRSLEAFIAESGLAEHTAPELLAALRSPRDSRLLIRTASAIQHTSPIPRLTLFNADLRPTWRL